MSRGPAIALQPEQLSETLLQRKRERNTRPRHLRAQEVHGQLSVRFILWYSKSCPAACPCRHGRGPGPHKNLCRVRETGRAQRQAEGTRRGHSAARACGSLQREKGPGRRAATAPQDARAAGRARAARPASPVREHPGSLTVREARLRSPRRSSGAGPRGAPTAEGGGRTRPGSPTPPPTSSLPVPARPARAPFRRRPGAAKARPVRPRAPRKWSCRGAEAGSGRGRRQRAAEEVRPALELPSAAGRAAPLRLGLGLGPARPRGCPWGAGGRAGDAGRPWTPLRSRCRR